MASETVTLAVQGMNCQSCVAHVAHALENLGGVERAEVDLAAAKATVTFAPGRVEQAEMVAAIAEAGYTAVVR